MSASTLASLVRMPSAQHQGDVRLSSHLITCTLFRLTQVMSKARPSAERLQPSLSRVPVPLLSCGQDVCADYGDVTVGARDALHIQ